MRDADGRFTKEDYNAAVPKLMAFARTGTPPDPIVGKLLGGEAAEWEHAAVTGFLLYGHRDREGKRVVDRFISTRGRMLPAGEVAALVALQQARASLFEVEGVQLGSGIDFRDLITGERVHVHEVSATAQLKKWDVLFAWVMSCDDHLEMSGAACAVPRPHLDRVRTALTNELVQARLQHPGLPDRELIGSIAWAPIVALREAIRSVRMPEMRTTDGEALVLNKAYYVVRDVNAVRERLNASAELDADDDGGFTWLNRDGNARMGTGPVVLGHIRLDAGELVLETMSRERNARGRAMLEERLGVLIAHRADSIEDPEVAMRRPSKRGAIAESDVPEDVQREVVGQYLRDHYRRWLDDPLPALGGKSPRKAVRTKRGRGQVEALLKEIENGTLGQPGGDTVDFAALRHELGLDHAPTTPERYDANEPPDFGRWLVCDESLRILAVEAHHRELGAHPEMPNPRLHALMHVIVENQLAANEPVEVRPTLDRLRSAGLTRHEALHAIGSVVAEQLFKVMKEGAPLDRSLIARSLARLRPDAWRFSRSRDL